MDLMNKIKIINMNKQPLELKESEMVVFDPSDISERYPKLKKTEHNTDPFLDYFLSLHGFYSRLDANGLTLIVLNPSIFDLSSIIISEDHILKKEHRISNERKLVYDINKVLIFCSVEDYAMGKHYG